MKKAVFLITILLSLQGLASDYLVNKGMYYGEGSSPILGDRGCSVEILRVYSNGDIQVRSSLELSKPFGYRVENLNRINHLGHREFYLRKKTIKGDDRIVKLGLTEDGNVARYSTSVVSDFFVTYIVNVAYCHIE